MTGTPDSVRLHIVLVGERNSGKSSLLNAIAGQQVAIVSDTPGTTTDHISKPMEIIGIGPCVLVDTAGMDDSGELGDKRVQASIDAIRTADILLAIIDAQTGRMPALPSKGATVIPVINKSEMLDAELKAALATAIVNQYGKEPVFASAHRNEGISEILESIKENIPEDWDAPLLTAGLLEPGELAVLVMPQDRQAPKGRLILPQQQTIRELLDRGCRIMCCTPETLGSTLEALNEAPACIISDAQALVKVKELKPEGCKLTSFSMLLAASKGDIEYFKRSARKIDSLSATSKVLIAEACCHVPASEDIGRVQIPRLLRARAGDGLQIDVVSGRDFPADLSAYELVIHCGACMFNRRYVLSRVRQAKDQGVPMTNYGITIAYINNLI